MGISYICWIVKARSKQVFPTLSAQVYLEGLFLGIQS